MRAKARTLLAVGLVSAIAAAVVGAAQPVSAQSIDDIRTRDALITNQESLLNTYRCMFDIDTQIVPGGCTDGKPAQPITPTESTTPQPTTPTSNDSTDHRFTAVAAGRRHTCAIKSDMTISCWGDYEDDKTVAPPGKFTAIAAGSDHTCAIRTDNVAACWGEADTLHSGGCTTRVDKIWICATPKPSSPEFESKFTPINPIDAPWGTTDCAVRKSNANIFCWGGASHSKTDPPPDEFISIATGWGSLARSGRATV